MKKFNKLFAISIIFSCFILNLALADDKKTDCQIFWREVYNDWFNAVKDVWETNVGHAKFLTMEQQRQIITKDDLNTAILNLKKYCCDNELWSLSMELETCKNEKFFNSNALDSQYLFDHIFDVMMRRLTWLTWDNDIYPNMTVDDKGEKRRTRIDSKAEDLSWSDSQSIIDWYLTTWTLSKPELWYDITNEIIWDRNIEKGIFDGGTLANSDKDFLNFVSWWSGTQASKKVANALKNYDKWTLYDRYNNVCAVSAYLYILLENWLDSEGREKMVEALHSWRCYEIVQNQIEWENIYVQLITQKASTSFLSNYIEWYVSYLYERWNKLRTLRKNSTDRFLDVVRAVPQLLGQCRK